MSKTVERLPERALNPNFIAGVLSAYHRADDETYQIYLQGMALAVCLHRLTDGQPLTFTLEEFITAMQAGPPSEGMSVEYDWEANSVTVQHKTQRRPSLQEHLESLFEPEPEHDA